ncbi:invasion associated locus B family protein [Ancylobacter radicis]|uniref:Invasion associated locus B family protein n=1 Tax=Ancylobacter radicis TaxID=2836179 RepID=A0ABS5R8T0_9HYPH|nr:invasion associated locus B family protein [Ancylobacter radicis]MBS9476772.1 invasion associated locus B family protein [Ancylobacter radicis]
MLRLPSRPTLAFLGSAALMAALMPAVLGLSAAPAWAQTAPKPAAAVPAAAPAAPKADAAKTDAPKPDASLPGGATSLQESFDDWTVNCALPGGRRVCVLAQVQVDQQSKQRALAIEVGATDTKSVTGIMALPFGIALASGAIVQIDDAAPLPPLPFQVCLPAGCIVQFRFDGDTLARMKAGQQMKITARAFEGGKSVVLTVSLKGFAAGLTRLQSLL